METIIALYEGHVLQFAYICGHCDMPVWQELDEDGRPDHGPIWKGFPLSFAIFVGAAEMFLLRPPKIFVTAETANAARRMLRARIN